jgi:hypothetical protein
VDQFSKISTEMVKKKLLFSGQTFWELFSTKHQLLAGPVVPN